MSRRPVVLLVAPDFRCATGMTPALVARHGRGFDYRLFPARDLRYRRKGFRRLLAAADLVHWHANLAHFPALLDEADRDGPTARIATVHHVGPDDAYVVETAVEHATRVHVPAPSVADAVRAAGAQLPVDVVPYVIEPPPTVRARQPREHEWVIGWCGSTGEPDDRKRLGLLIAALAGLADRHPVLALQGFVGPAVLASAADAGVEVRVTPALAWPDRWGFYGGIDLYCSPSSVEGGPLPVFEAASLGVPVVTTPVGMAAALVEAGGAWGIDGDDPDRLAAALAAAAAAPAAERAERLQRAREVARSFGPGEGVGRYERLYAEVLGVQLQPGRRSPAALVELTRNRFTRSSRAFRTARIALHRRRHGAGSSPFPPA